MPLFAGVQFGQLDVQTHVFGLLGDGPFQLFGGRKLARGLAAPVGLGGLVGHHVGAVFGSFISALADCFFNRQIADGPHRLFVAWLGLLDPVPTTDGLVEAAHSGQGPAALAIHFRVFRIDVQGLLQVDKLGFVEIQRLAGIGHRGQGRDVPGIEL